MTIVCKIPSLLAVYNVTWTRNGNALNLAEEAFEIAEHNLLKVRDMNVSSNEYKCMVYESSSDESPLASSPLMVYKYSKLYFNIKCYLACNNRAYLHTKFGLIFELLISITFKALKACYGNFHATLIN